MNSAPERESYGKTGLTWVDRWGVWLSRRRVERSLPTGREIDLLDIGCGHRALLLTALRPRLRRAVGVDYSVDAALAAAHGLEVIAMDAGAALGRLEGQRFDVVLLNSVLEHLPDPVAVLVQCRERLRPGGRLLINVPTWRGKQALEFSAFRLGLSPAEEMDDHKMYYDKRDLWPLLVRGGFKPSRISLSYHKFGLNLFAVAEV